MFFLVLKAAGCVVSALVVMICVFGHVESRKRQAENAIDCKYNGMPVEPSFRVSGVAKIDFHGNEIFSERAPSVRSLIGSPGGSFTTASSTLVK